MTIFSRPNSTDFKSNLSDFLTSVMNIGANEGASDRQNCSLFSQNINNLSIHAHGFEGGRVGRPGVKKSLSGNIIRGFQETLQAII